MMIRSMFLSLPRVLQASFDAHLIESKFEIWKIIIHSKHFPNNYILSYSFLNSLHNPDEAID